MQERFGGGDDLEAALRAHSVAPNKLLSTAQSAHSANEPSNYVAFDASIVNKPSVVTAAANSAKK